MKISACVENGEGQHQVTLTTDEYSHSIAIPPKTNGLGSSANGGELLFLALATCYCNDIYREAIKRDIKVERVEVEVIGEFGAEGDPARNVIYRAKVHAHGTEADIRALMQYTDTVAEIQNTVKAGIDVKLEGMEFELLSPDEH
jgi:organic hydroperoxide reductase OsmC/OhrA